MSTPRLIWRGPFRVVRAGRGAWKIINRHDDVERMGYRYKGAADEECRLLNLAQSYCDKEGGDTE
jgi:hypothetical protein